MSHRSEADLEKISVVILTYNSEATVRATLESAKEISTDLHVVDSYSTDATLDILGEYPDVRVAQREFKNYADQRNWAISELPLEHEWQLHLDADERLSAELVRELRTLDLDDPAGPDGYHIPRLVRFLGQDIRHGGMYPIYHMRLFRTGKGRCERRRYDQHFIVSGRARRLEAPMVDDIRTTLSEWTERHNRWSDAEVSELLSPSPEDLTPDLLGTPQQRRRWLRGLYNRTPLFLRALALFIYRYLIRGGFRDGKAGLIFFVLQTFWYRFLIDAKLYEAAHATHGRG